MLNSISDSFLCKDLNCFPTPFHLIDKVISEEVNAPIADQLEIRLGIGGSLIAVLLCTATKIVSLAVAFFCFLVFIPFLYLTSKDLNEPNEKFEELSHADSSADFPIKIDSSEELISEQIPDLIPIIEINTSLFSVLVEKVKKGEEQEPYPMLKEFWDNASSKEKLIFVKTFAEYEYSHPSFEKVRRSFPHHICMDSVQNQLFGLVVYKEIDRDKSSGEISKLVLRSQIFGSPWSKISGSPSSFSYRNAVEIAIHRDECVFLHSCPEILRGNGKFIRCLIGKEEFLKEEVLDRHKKIIFIANEIFGKMEKITSSNYASRNTELSFSKMNMIDFMKKIAEIKTLQDKLWNFFYMEEYSQSYIDWMEENEIGNCNNLVLSFCDQYESIDPDTQLSVASFSGSNHTFVIVGDDLVIDPWAKAIHPMSRKDLFRNFKVSVLTTIEKLPLHIPCVTKVTEEQTLSKYDPIKYSNEECDRIREERN